MISSFVQQAKSLLTNVSLLPR